MEATTNVETINTEAALTHLGVPIQLKGGDRSRKAVVNEPIHRRFAKLNMNYASILEFANAYGSLGHRNYALDVGMKMRFPGESVLDWAREIFIINRITRLWEWLFKDDVDSIRMWIEEYPTRVLLDDEGFPHNNYPFLRPEFWTFAGDDFVVSPSWIKDGDLPRYIQTPRAPLVASPAIGFREIDVWHAPLGIPLLEWLREENRIDCRQLGWQVVEQLLSAGMLRGTTNAIELLSTSGRHGNVVPIAKNLLGLIYVSLANEIMSGRVVRKICPCGHPIDDGPAESGRFPRYDKIYCSQSCKVKHHRKRKRELKELADMNSQSSS